MAWEFVEVGGGIVAVGFKFFAEGLGVVSIDDDGDVARGEVVLQLLNQSAAIFCAWTGIDVEQDEVGHPFLSDGHGVAFAWGGFDLGCCPAGKGETGAVSRGALVVEDKDFLAIEGNSFMYHGADVLNLSQVRFRLQI